MVIGPPNSIDVLLHGDGHRVDRHQLEHHMNATLGLGDGSAQGLDRESSMGSFYRAGELQAQQLRGGFGSVHGGKP